MVFKIDIQTSEIEFDFAGMLVTADASDENLAKMLDLKDSDLKAKAEKEADKLAEMDPEKITGTEFTELVNKTVDMYGSIYAPVFGETAFADVYKHVRSIRNTVKGFEEAIDYITDEMEKQNKNFETKQKNKVDKYRKRKKK